MYALGVCVCVCEEKTASQFLFPNERRAREEEKGRERESGRKNNKRARKTDARKRSIKIE